MSKLVASFIILTLSILMTNKLVNFLYQEHIKANSSNVRGYVIEGTTKSKALVEGMKKAAVSIRELLSFASKDRGEVLAKKCMVCHSFYAGQPNKIGPNLHGVVGKEKASTENYKYSQALKSKGGKWEEEELFKFLQNPKQYVDGTKMAFPGIKDPQENADIITFLKEIE